MKKASGREIRFFGFGILTGLGAVFGSILAVGAGLATFAPESMPAPAISSLVHIDEKLRFMREHPDYKPNILAVGSSVTWRQLSGEAFGSVDGGDETAFLNGGTAHLQVHQTRAMSRFLLDHYPSVGTLLVLLSLPDFKNCTSEPEHLFPPRDAARYAFGNWPAVYFYLHYVSPMRYVRTAMTLADRKAPLIGDLYLDDYGSGPLQVPEEKQRGLRYGRIEPDAACVAALEALVAETAERGVRLLLVFSPIHPGYRERHPASVEWLGGVARRVAAAARAKEVDTKVLDLRRHSGFEEGDFYDAFHLQWRAVRELSATLAASMEDGQFVRQKTPSPPGSLNQETLSQELAPQPVAVPAPRRRQTGI